MLAILAIRTRPARLVALAGLVPPGDLIELFSCVRRYFSNPSNVRQGRAGVKSETF